MTLLGGNGDVKGDGGVMGRGFDAQGHASGLMEGTEKLVRRTNNGPRTTAFGCKAPSGNRYHGVMVCSHVL